MEFEGEGKRDSDLRTGQWPPDRIPCSLSPPELTAAAPQITSSVHTLPTFFKNLGAGSRYLDLFCPSRIYVALICQPLEHFLSSPYPFPSSPASPPRTQTLQV